MVQYAAKLLEKRIYFTNGLVLLNPYTLRPCNKRQHGCVKKSDIEEAVFASVGNL